MAKVGMIEMIEMIEMIKMAKVGMITSYYCCCETFNVLSRGTRIGSSGTRIFSS